MKNKTILVTFIFFLIAMVMGWLLRLQFVQPFNFVKYKHILHAHSHVILLGWVFNAVYIAITSIYHPKGSERNKRFRRLFWFIQITILLAMLGFLYQGYAFFSILFSTAFLIGTFIWAAWLWKDLRNDNSIGGRFIFLAILFLLLSSLGPLSLGAIMSTSLKDTAAYPLSIYFYLHFLYNGFFIFALIGAWFKYLDQQLIAYSAIYAKRFYLGMKWSIIPLYALSAVWLNEYLWINVLGGIAALVQLWGGYYLYKIIQNLNRNIHEKVYSTKNLLIKIAIIVFSAKLILQLFSSIQWVADISLAAKNTIIIGYIHLIMLGLITIFILWYFSIKQWIVLTNKWAKIGLYLFLFGVLMSETLLFSQGFTNLFLFKQLPYYFQLLLLVSGLMPVGILLLIVGQYKKAPNIIP